MTRHPKWQKVIGVVAALLTAALVPLLVGFLVLTQTQRGRRVLADVLQDLVSKEIPGTMTIGKLERIGTSRTRVHDVEFFHENGNRTLGVSRAEIDFDWSYLLRGGLAFDGAFVRGGEVVLAVAPDGRLGLEATLDAPTLPGEPDDPYSGLQYNLRNIRFESLKTILRLSKDETFRLHNTSGRIAIWREDTKGVRLKLDDIAGGLQPEVMGSTIRLLAADGRVQGKEQHVLHIEFSTAVGEGRMDGKVDYFDRPKNPVQVELRPQRGVQASWLAFVANVGSNFIDDIEIDVR